MWASRPSLLRSGPSFFRRPVAQDSFQQSDCLLESSQLFPSQPAEVACQIFDSAPPTLMQQTLAIRGSANPNRRASFASVRRSARRLFSSPVTMRLMVGGFTCSAAASWPSVIGPPKTSTDSARAGPGLRRWRHPACVPGVGDEWPWNAAGRRPRTSPAEGIFFCLRPAMKYS